MRVVSVHYVSGMKLTRVDSIRIVLRIVVLRWFPFLILLALILSAPEYKHNACLTPYRNYPITESAYAQLSHCHRVPPVFVSSIKTTCLVSNFFYHDPGSTVPLRNHNLPILIKHTILSPPATMLARLNTGAFDLARAASLASNGLSVTSSQSQSIYIRILGPSCAPGAIHG